MLPALLLFLILTAAISYAGMKFYVKPKEAIERVSGAGMTAAMAGDSEMSSPALMFQNLMQKLGDYLPASPKDVNIMQKRLFKAGIRQPNAIKVLYGAKLSLGVLLPVLVFASMANRGTDTGMTLIYTAGAAAVGFFAPNEYVNRKLKSRMKAVAKGLANALDLMVVCVESGLGLDQALLQVAKDMEQAHPEISEEFSLVNYELKAGKRRVEALRNLADRTGVEDLKRLVAVLIQADRFGTGIAQSLRAHSDYMRIQARQIAEEKAAKLGVKLIFPIFFCVLPSLFVVTVGPVVMKIIRELIPMMQNV